MNRILRPLVTGLLQSRAGLALVLAVLVLSVVGAARALMPVDGGVGPVGPVRPLVAAPTEPDDGPLSPDATPSPTRVPGSPAPVEVAKAFAANWIAHLGVTADEWRDRLAQHSTDDLAQQLAGVAPEVVPADRLTGEPVVIPRAATIVEVMFPVDTGELRLRLIATEGQWLVDGIDWARA